MATMEEKIVSIDDFWNSKKIPAILLKKECNFPGRSQVWIPEGYENGGGGYSMRITETIKEFQGPAEIINDVLAKWASEKKH
jgi:hypothetical protein